MPRSPVHILSLILLVLSACRGCPQRSSSEVDAGVDGGVDAGAPVISQRVALPGGGSLEVRSGARALVELRERPGVDAEAWRRVSAVAALTAGLVLAHPLEEVKLSFEPMGAGAASAESAGGAAGVAALAVLGGAGPLDAGTPVAGVLYPDGLIVTASDATPLRAHWAGRVPAALEPEALRLPQALEVAFASRASQWLEEATGVEAQLPARKRAQITAAVDAANRVQGVERLERARQAVELTRAVSDATPSAQVVVRWQRTRADLEAQPVRSPTQAAQLLEAGRRLASAWVLLQGTPTAASVAAASVRLDEVDTWLTGVSQLAPSKLAPPERMAAVARVWLEAGRLSGGTGPEVLGLELAASLLGTPTPSSAASLIALAAAQDAYLSAAHQRLPAPAAEASAGQASDLELRRAAGRVRRAVGLPPGVAYDVGAAGRAAPESGSRLLRWRATTTAHVILQLTSNPSLLQ